jgi:hypothetical protein
MAYAEELGFIVFFYDALGLTDWVQLRALLPEPPIEV